MKVESVVYQVSDYFFLRFLGLSYILLQCVDIDYCTKHCNRLILVEMLVTYISKTFTNVVRQFNYYLSFFFTKSGGLSP